jgi:PilZ domain
MATNAEFATISLNKRRWRRLHFTVPVRVALGKSRHGTVINSRGCQMNPGGIGFFADSDLAIGDEVEIELTDYQLTLRGVIRDYTGYRYGVEFLATNAEENEQLELYRRILSSKLGCLDA